jgi:5,6-dimethylbenzimidazole synthase
MPATTESLYDVIHRRRDVRSEFTGAAIEDETLKRILGAAHSAPSVGLSQPWDFILIGNRAVKAAFKAHVCEEARTFADTLTAERGRLFERIKIEGIEESTLSIVVAYDPDRGAPHVLGRHAIADAGLFSVCLAIENLWLAAAAEGWGVGWVSFYREDFLRGLLGIPEPVRPVAWLCVGPVTHVAGDPDLERNGWRRRRPLAAALHYERWNATAP